MNIKFVIVSKDSNFKMHKERLCIDKEGVSIDVEYVPDNKESLAKIYNMRLRDERSNRTHDCIAFMHSDVSFNVPMFIDHLSSIYTKYGLIGLCGTSTFNVSKSPLNWFTSSSSSPYSRWGCVTHGEIGDQTSFFSNHSPSTLDAEVACIDGLCIIFTNIALDTDMEFDETLGKFDFYDSDISCQAMMKYGIKIGVMVQKDLCHYSIGKSITTPEFLDVEEKFRAKWKFPIPMNSAIAKHIEMKRSFGEKNILA